MSAPARYLIVDGHSVIFASPELRRAHDRRSSFGRDLLVKRLRNYQDWTGVKVVVVFDGAGTQVATSEDPHDIQIFYSRAGQTADAIIERLTSRYASRHQITVATNDYMEQETASAAGAETMSAESLLGLLDETEQPRRPIKSRRI